MSRLLAVICSVIILSACTGITFDPEARRHEFLVNYWLNAGFTQEQATLFASKSKVYIANDYNVEIFKSVIQKYEAAGIPFADAKPWFESGNYNEGLKWIKEGFVDYDFAVDWSNLIALNSRLDRSGHYNEPQIVKSWIDAGFNNESAKPWIVAKFILPKSAFALHSAGIQPADIPSDWAAKLPYMAADTVVSSVEWIKSKRSFSEGVLFVKTFGYTPAQADQWSKQCQGSISDNDALVRTGAYSVSGKCFIFPARMIQAKNRREGLFRLDGGQYIFLEWEGGKPVPPKDQWHVMLAVGIDAYQYNALSGLKTVPKLKVLDAFSLE